jgi:DNA primase
MRVNLLALIGRDTKLTRTCSKHGGEYAGPCPLCRRGTDRFKVWPQIERWACLGPEAGRAGCDLSGDAVQYLRQRDGLSYAEACAALGIQEDFNAKTQATGGRTGKVAKKEGTVVSADKYAKDFLAASAPLRLGVQLASPPNDLWQAHGRELVERCQARLWAEEGRRALDYLHARGLGDEILRAYAAGYLPHDEHQPRALWGLPEGEGAARPVWLPRGVVFPWFADGALWRINIRRPISARQAAAGQPKYMGPAGFASALYNADALGESRPAALVEGEIDALTIVQEAGDLIAAVATGSTAGGRRAPWIGRLAEAPFVLLAFDCDANQAGEQAARWWLQTLPNALRWRPLLHDANAMHVAGVSVRQWIAAGIEYATEHHARLCGRTGMQS